MGHNIFLVGLAELDETDSPPPEGMGAFRLQGWVKTPLSGRDELPSSEREEPSGSRVGSPVDRGHKARS